MMATLYEKMKAAWDSKGPPALDREAEDMARHGIAEKDIYAALEELLLTVRAAGADEETEERINGVMDRLTGWCHPTGHIRTFRNNLPTEDEIAKLPRWARVAFAARCARRVLPLYYEFRDADMRVIEKLDLRWVLDETEESAATTHPQLGVQTGYEETAAGGYADDDKRDEAAYSAANAVAYAAAEAGDNNRPARRTFVAMNHAAFAARPVGDISAVIRRDFDHLARLAEWQKWTDDTPVPPEVFGPLWPEGPPKGWPATEVPARTELALEAFARDRATEQMIEDDVVNLFNALNRYHIARSGVRLTLEQFRSLLPSVVPAEA